MRAVVSRRRQAARHLDYIRSVFGLSEGELADLFGVRRQSIAEWRTLGVPVQRIATVEHISGLAKVLSEEIIPRYIPEVVRQKDAWLDNKSILETLRQEGVDSVYAYLHRLFTSRGA